MKIFFYLVLILLFTGCLVPGAPQYFHFKSNKLTSLDSVTLVSFPNSIDYQYLHQDIKFDSVYLFEPFKIRSQKMVETSRQFSNGKNITYMSLYNRQRWNLKKVSKLDFLVVEKFYNNNVVVDTFYRSRR